jgi:cathepsin F/cysteine peptidase B
VKNQGNCGSCWAFSSTGSLEGQWALAGNALVNLSEQLLVSCNPSANGCNGYEPDAAIDWIVQSNGGVIATEAPYPYESTSGSVPPCSTQGNQPGALVLGRFAVWGETIISEWLAAVGPISVCLDATSFQTYQGGIMTNCISQQIDHCVLAVGYDFNFSPPYWIVKNSWGQWWGEDGYIRIAFGSNQCLIANQGMVTKVDVSCPAESGLCPGNTVPACCPNDYPQCCDGYDYCCGSGYPWCCGNNECCSGECWMCGLGVRGNKSTGQEGVGRLAKGKGGV